MKKQQQYWSNGLLCEEYHVNDRGAIDGEFKSWYENGTLKIHCFYQNGKLQGEYKRWHSGGIGESIGPLFTHCLYNQNGEFHGEYKQWYSNGKLWIHSFYQNGMLHGECIKRQSFYIELERRGEFRCILLYEHDAITGGSR